MMATKRPSKYFGCSKTFLEFKLGLLTASLLLRMYYNTILNSLNFRYCSNIQRYTYVSTLVGFESKIGLFSNTVLFIFKIVSFHFIINRDGFRFSTFVAIGKLFNSSIFRTSDFNLNFDVPICQFKTRSNWLALNWEQLHRCWIRSSNQFNRISFIFGWFLTE